MSRPNTEYIMMRFKKAEQQKIAHAAIEVSYNTGESFQWTDVIRHLVDNYLEPCKRDLARMHGNPAVAENSLKYHYQSPLALEK